MQPAKNRKFGGYALDTDLSAYVKSISHEGQYGPLASADEIHLAQRIRQGDFEARQTLIRHNLRLVISVAKDYSSRGLDLSDLIEAGNIGLITAVEKYDPDRGRRFSTYATWWIKHTIRRSILHEGQTIRVPVHMFENVMALRKLNDRFTLTPGEISYELKVPLYQAINLWKGGNALNSMSLDQLMDTEDWLFSNSDNTYPNPQGANADIEEYMKCLSSREKIVIMRRFGLNEFPPSTLQEIADDLNCTREWVRNLQSQALDKIRFKFGIQIESIAPTPVQ
jgi:RNA polymerase sigma factor (sigma-70 family)